MVTIIGAVSAIAFAGQANPTPEMPLTATQFYTGREFQSQLDKPLSGAWSNEEVRSLVNRIARDRRVSVVLDRRIDPSRRISVDLSSPTLKEGLQDLAQRLPGESVVLENVVFIGPRTATQSLRTLIELRTQELVAKAGTVPESRRNELQKTQRFTWEDLDTPRDILQKIATHYHLSVRQSDRVPHDLWAAGCLPAATAAQALSLVLIQFDLTFRWIDGGEGIELVPVPERVVVERRHRLKGRSAADAKSLVLQEFPELDIQVASPDLVGHATVEEHEAIEALLNPSTARKPTTKPTPLRQRTFTLTGEHLPVRMVMKKLEASGVVFEYNLDALKKAGINLDHEIDIKVEKVSAEELFKTMFTPLGLKFEMDQLTVRLTPK